VGPILLVGLRGRVLLCAQMKGIPSSEELRRIGLRSSTPTEASLPED